MVAEECNLYVSAFWNEYILYVSAFEKIKTNDFHMTRKRTTKNFNQPGEMKLHERAICMHLP